MFSQQPARIYFDLLDTVRTSERPEELARSDQPYLPVGQMMLSILCGEIPVFAQNQSIDSSILLKAAASSSDGPYFRGLVKNGYVRFHLFKKPTIMDAFKAALTGSFRFSAWPEIEHADQNLRVARSAVLDLVNGKNPTDIPESVRQRVEALTYLSEAQARAAQTIYPNDQAVGYERTLTEEIERAIAISQLQESGTHLTPNVEEALIMIADSRGRNLDRSGWYEAIEQAFNAPQGVIDEQWMADEQFSHSMEAKSVVDLCNNNLTSTNLRIELEEFTAKGNRPLQAIKASISPHAVSGDILDAGISSNLEPMGWADVSDFLKAVSDPMVDYKDREVLEKLAKKIAIIQVGNQWRYKIIPQLTGLTTSGFVGAAAGLVVRAAVNDPSISIGAGLFMAWIAEVVKKSMPAKSKRVEDWLIEHLAKKNVGKLETRYHLLKGSTEE